MGRAHSPALDVHALGERSFPKQMRASCNMPDLHDVRNAVLGNVGFAAEKASSIDFGLSFSACAGALNSAGIVTESRALRTAAK